MMDNSKEAYLEIFNSINFQEIRKHPNILIAARFWEEERYLAAKNCYRLMRNIDDMIDDYKAENNSIGRAARIEFKKKIRDWLKKFNRGSESGDDQILNTINQFKIPSWPFKNFAESMLFDVDHNGFKTVRDFLDYSEGASVAPASVFVHLCGLSEVNGIYYKPAFNVRKVATPCALFSYIVHIIRDFQIDHKSNLNYFAGDLMNKYNITELELRRMADQGEVNENFRKMIGEYYDLAEKYMYKTYHIIREVWANLDNRHRLSLLIIFNLYLITFEKIDIQNGNFTQHELEPTASEIKDRVLRVILEFSPELHENKKVLIH